jgi:outer membrane protein OmpA-like peptidoglycan-associated protein
VVIAEAAPRPPSPADEAPPRPDPEAAPARAVLTRAAIQIAQAIRFENDLAVIRPGSEVVLGDVAAIFRAHPEIGKVRVEGYTDSNGDAAHNMRLSRMRAQAVQRWLVEKGGVDAARLDADGFGASRPVAPNVTQAGRARNRRVEFRIVGVQ